MSIAPRLAVGGVVVALVVALLTRRPRVNAAAPWRDRMARPEEEARVIADLDARMQAPARFVLRFVRGQGHKVRLAFGRRGPSLTERIADMGTGLRRGSKHEQGLAFDIVALRGWWEGPDAAALWPDMGRAVEQWNALHPDQPLTWGGSWQVPWDPAHVEWRNA